MDITTLRILETLVYPPAGLLLLALAGWAITWRRPRLGLVLSGVALVLLYVAGLPVATQSAMRWLEHTPPFEATQASGAQAIVVLGYTRDHAAPEYGGATSAGGELVRLRYAARLARQLQLPVAVIGDDPYGEGQPPMPVMSRVLAEDFRTAPRWQDLRSLTTWDNARNARELLGPEGIRRIVLVTHAWHMPRARLAFVAHGFEVTAAPTGYTARTAGEAGLGDLVPDAEHYVRLQRVLHELAGSLWYRLKTPADPEAPPV